MFAALRRRSCGRAQPSKKIDRRLWMRGSSRQVRTNFERRYRVVGARRTPRKSAGPTCAMLSGAFLAGFLLGAFAGRQWSGARARSIEPARSGVSRVAAPPGSRWRRGRRRRRTGSVAVALARCSAWPCLSPGERVGAETPWFCSCLSSRIPETAGGHWRVSPLSVGALLLANLNLSLRSGLRFQRPRRGHERSLVVMSSGGPSARPWIGRRAGGGRPDDGSGAIGSARADAVGPLARGGDFRNSLWQCHQLLWMPSVLRLPVRPAGPGPCALAAWWSRPE